MPPRITPRCAEIALNLTRPMFHIRDRWLLLAHMLLMRIGWISSPLHRCTSFDALTSNARDAATCPTKKKLRQNIVPHRENVWKTCGYKLGRNNALALLPQLSNQGPLTCGSFTCQPPYLPRGATRAFAWTNVAPTTRPRLLRAT